MKSTFLLTFTFILAGIYVAGQNTIKIVGIVRDASTGEFLQAATIKNMNDIRRSTVTNTYGNFIINIESETPVFLEITYIGYQPSQLMLNLSNDTVLDINLIPGVELEEQTITSSHKSYSNKSQVGKLILNTETIRFSPAIAGESNVLAALKFLPGVSFGKEGSSELYVRGGSHDQNMILLDNSPVYNLNHAFGLLSVFNSDALKNVSLYKGGIPAEFGGRLSSVLDVSVKEGNRKAYSSDLTISTIALTATAEGPLVKDNASFLISARRSWPDLVVRGINAGNENNMSIGYSFMDINVKTNFTLQKRHHFYLSYYTGHDNLYSSYKTEQQKSEMNQGWGNHIASFRYQAVSDAGIFNEALLYYSSFFESDLNGIYSYEKKLTHKNLSRLDEIGFKTSREWERIKLLRFKTGINGLWRSIQPPYKTIDENGDMDTVRQSTPIHQKEIAVFLSCIYSGTKLDLQVGIRTSLFGEFLFDYFTAEPRLSINYHLNENFSLKSSSMHNTQSVFSMSKSVQGMPGYTWLPATGELSPQSSWQASMGAIWEKGRLFFDAEFYYKWLKNICGNYLYPATLFQSSEWYEIIDQGKGKSYGLDLLAQYFAKRYTINFKYSLGKVQHSFPSVLNGQWIPANYDIRHDASITGNWVIQQRDKNKKWLTWSFTTHSGIPVSLPSQSISSILPTMFPAEHFYDLSYFYYFPSPNNVRLKAYHRLDIAFHTKKELAEGNRSWSLGIMNIYNRQNPYSIYKDQKGNFKQVVLFPFMPFVSFKRSFY